MLFRSLPHPFSKVHLIGVKPKLEVERLPSTIVAYIAKKVNTKNEIPLERQP